jgi:hypothetical protein
MCCYYTPYRRLLHCFGPLRARSAFVAGPLTFVAGLFAFVAGLFAFVAGSGSSKRSGRRVWGPADAARQPGE